MTNDMAQYFDSKHNVFLRKVHKNIICNISRRIKCIIFHP